METLTNSTAIDTELEYLEIRIRNLLQNSSPEAFHLPELNTEDIYGAFVKQYQLTEAERLVLMVAFAATCKPQVLLPFDLLFSKAEQKRPFGGVYKEDTALFYPTLRTAIYCLCGTNNELFKQYAAYFNNRNKLFTSGLIHTISTENNRVFIDNQLVFNDQFLPCLLSGAEPLLDAGAGFPARRSKRTHTMDAVVLTEETQKELNKLYRFARNMKALWTLHDRNQYRQNFIGIFSGDPGTGKSHTAEAIGNELGLPVYKVNFAQLVSKYIGETEKNLELIFDRFHGHPSILFFDEAESIFSKRTDVKDAHDKHANNEQSYLLQKIEEYNGIVILATNVQNLAQYFDKAFQRRIRHIVNFPFPDFPERQRLWENALGVSFVYEEGLINKLAKNYQLSGGSIYNVISEGVIEALDRRTDTITFEMLEEAMKDEFKKTGRKYEVCTDQMVAELPSRRFGTGYEHRKNF